MRKDKKKIGRPCKYDPSMCATVIRMMKDGASKCEVAAELDVDDETLSEWAKKFPEFSATIKRGEQLSKAWWLGKGRKNLENRLFNYVGFYMQMKNRFGWSDKQSMEHSGAVHLHVD